jgi:GT2 family glycosyltransferase
VDLLGKKRRSERRRCEKLREAGFDAPFYVEAIGTSVVGAMDPVLHYHRVGWKRGIDPTPWFSVSGYLERYPDVRVLGVDPFLHFAEHGKAEERNPAPFLTRDPHIELIGGSSPSADHASPAHAHPPAPAPAAPTPQPEPAATAWVRGDHRADGRSEWVSYAQLRMRANQVAGQAGAPAPDILDFTVALSGSELAAHVNGLRLGKASKAAGTPLVSIVIPCWEEAAVSAEAFHSVFAESETVSVEVVVVNNGSRDPFFAAISDHPDLVWVEFEKNVGFGPACNAGVERASGEYILLLNNDAQLAPGSIQAMVNAFATDDRIAVVGPKIISFDGRLQEAGTIIKADGTGQLIGFAASPDEPRFNYPRCVEHLSAAAVVIRRDVFLAEGGFDPAYAPAYCEDADLSLKLRAKGYRLFYEPKALVAHHLSKSTASSGKKQLLRRNRATLLRRWASELTNFDIRTIAFYLPQYHPIPENDRWWGKGFTEWTNLTKSEPKFAGHRQPRRPADLGYYDLRATEVMEQQAALAKRYGVSGFCYYYYRFGDKRLLETPIEKMLATGRPDFPFCICWANENWSRRWDGEDQDILMAQSYEENDAIGFAEDVARFFKSKNYITIEGKPLVLIYRLQEIPNPRRYIQVCRNSWKRHGFPEVVVAMVESFELSASPKPPQTFGADLTVEFPAHGMVHDPAISVHRTDADWHGNAHDYRELANAFVSRQEVGFSRCRSVLVGWDTTPRHPTKSFVLQNANPGAFQAWLEWTYQRTREQNFGDERLVFINAWNEWCEGSYLEPDTDFGHGYLQAVRNAQETVALGKECFVEVA